MAAKVVLDNVTPSFLHGAKIGVVGPNGTGKSSLLKIMAGPDHPNNGDAILDPEATVGMSSRSRCSPRARRSRRTSRRRSAS